MRASAPSPWPSGSWVSRCRTSRRRSSSARRRPRAPTRRRPVLRKRSRVADEHDMTLVELLVVISLLGVVLPMLTAFMISIQNTLVKETNRSQSNDQVRLAVESLDRETRSGNVLYDPQSENDAAHYIFPGMSLRIYTQSNATTRGPRSDGERCVQWRIKYHKYADTAGTQLLPTDRQSYELQRRGWARGRGGRAGEGSPAGGAGPAGDPGVPAP